MIDRPTSPFRTWTPAVMALWATACFPASGPSLLAQEPRQRYPVEGRLVLAPLENLTAEENADEVVGRLLEASLRDAGLSLGDSIDGALPVGRNASDVELRHAAASNGAGYALFGKVLEFGFRDLDREAGLPAPVVSLDLQLMNVETGNVVWRERLYGPPGLGPSEAGLGAISQGLAATVADALAPTGAL